MRSKDKKGIAKFLTLKTKITSGSIAILAQNLVDSLEEELG